MRWLSFLLTPLILPFWLLCLGYSNSAGSALIEVPEAVKSPIPAPSIDAKSWVLADFETGWILGSKNADLRIEPASLTKLMTSSLVFDAIKTEKLRFDDKVYISKKAWKTEGSRMFILVDTHVSVLDLIQGLIVQSGNDAAVALAEHIAGSEEEFAVRMNLMAAKIGMTNTNFTNSSGLPHDNHYTTARDITLLALSLIRRFPDLYHYYSQREFTYNDITQPNRNILLDRDPTVDGLKTGYTRKAGYCMIGTALRDEVRLIATVTGAKNKTVRANQAQSLLQYGYDSYDGMIVYRPGEPVKTLPLWMGQQDQASAGVLENLAVQVPSGESARISVTLELPDSLEAPLASGTEVGQIQLTFDDKPIRKSSLHVIRTHEEGPIMAQILDWFKRLIF